MDEKKNFELDDNMLESVAGGAGARNPWTKQFPTNCTVEHHCPYCEEIFMIKPIQRMKLTWMNDEEFLLVCHTCGRPHEKGNMTGNPADNGCTFVEFLR